METEPAPNGNQSAAATAAAAAAVASGAAAKVESVKLEHQLVRVPFEHYKRTIRANHRAVEKEISAVISGVSDAAEFSRDDAVQHLNSLVSRLQGLKRKLEEGSCTENLQAQKCRTRLDHLESADADNLLEFNDTRLKRILVDYMLRMSYYDTAVKLAESCNIQDLVDIEVFYEAKKVVDALQNKEVASALAWCAENKSRLKKFKSKFEFQLRLQEFIELVRAESNLRAIAYARKHLAPWGATHMKELQRVVATLAFKSSTECATYKALFEPKQWDYLVDQFRQEFCRIYGMTYEPLLNIYLQAGLSALKTEFCYKDDCTKEDPLSQESFRKLAGPLPFSKQHHSKLVCYITKELMDTENPPLVLPNGYVYSTKCLLSELYSYQDPLPLQHPGKRNMMKSLATTHLKAQATEDISTTEIHTSAPVSELPSVYSSSPALTNALSPRVAMKGKFIKSKSDTTIKDEEDPMVTAQPLGIDKFIFECNQTLAKEEPRGHASLPPFAPNEIRTEPTPSRSLNLTEIAAMANDEADSKEFTSAFNPGFVTVGAYTVKKEFASVLEEILSNQGDIAEACSLRTNEMRSTFLEVICDGIQRLRELSFKKVRPELLKLFLNQISDLERVGVRVGWLREKVAEIDEVKAKFKESPSLKLAKTRSIEAIVKAETEMLLLEKKMNSLKEKIAELKAESEKIDVIALDAKVTVNYFYNRRLLDSLA